MGTITMTPAPGATAGPQAMRVAPVDTSVFNDVVGGTIDSVRSEVNDCYEEMQTFHNNEPDHCTRLIVGHSARLAYIAVLIRRIQDFEPAWKQVLDREIEPTLRMLERQYDMASRRHTYRELDWRMETGER